MSEFIAGIAVFPVGVEEYDVSISLVSATDGSVVGNKTSSSPSKLTSLTETIKSILSTFPEPRTIQSYFTSVPPAFPADRYYEVFKAVKSAKLIDEYKYPALPLNHGEAYAVKLAKRTTTSLLVLDFSRRDHLYAASLRSTEKDGKRVNTMEYEFSISFDEEKDLQAALQRIITSQKKSNAIAEQTVVIQPIDTQFDIVRLVADVYPNVPVSIATYNDIAQAAASFAYDHSLLHVPFRLAQFCFGVPVSVATASGTTVPLAQSSNRIPTRLSITLTNVRDEQKSVTVRLLIGNHAQAKDNLQRAVVVLDGLNPLPRGEARIKVLIKMLDLEGWRDAAQIVLEQKDGPKRKFLFSCFFANLPEDRRKYDIRMKKDVAFKFKARSEEVVGKLDE